VYKRQDLASVANANAITVVPGNSPLQAGDTIEVLPFDGWLNQ